MGQMAADARAQLLAALANLDRLTNATLSIAAEFSHENVQSILCADSWDTL